MRETYGQLWDRYVEVAFPRLQNESGGDLTYPGEEWGSEKSWNAIFNHLFVPSGVKDWSHAIEIGGGGGKYTERVLNSNGRVKVWGFDVSRSFLDATAERLSQHVDASRLILNEIDSDHPDAMLQLFEKKGLTRKIDAMFSIDAMVHVDLQYLVTYWINAALVLKPGGRILMTLADPTSDAGFQKLIRDIKKFYKFQGRICPKFEYLDKQMVTHILEHIGFDIEYLEQWTFREGAMARDLYLIARLERPEQAKTFRTAISTQLPLAALPSEKHEPSATAAPQSAEVERANQAPVSSPEQQPKSIRNRSRPRGVEETGKPAPAPITAEKKEAAQELGKAYWRALILQSNPNITKAEMREQFKHSWGGSRREYSQLGMTVLKQLENKGFKITKHGDLENAGSSAEMGVSGMPGGTTQASPTSGAQGPAKA